MAKVKDLDSIQTREDALKWSEQHGGTIKEGGCHTLVIGTVKTSRPVPIARHHGHIPNGTLHKMKKELAAAFGIALIIVAGLIYCF